MTQDSAQATANPTATRRLPGGRAFPRTRGPRRPRFNQESTFHTRFRLPWDGEQALLGWPGSIGDLPAGAEVIEDATGREVVGRVRGWPSGRGGELVVPVRGRPDLQLRAWVWKEGPDYHPLVRIRNRVTGETMTLGPGDNRELFQQRGRFVPHDPRPARDRDRDREPVIRPESPRPVDDGDSVSELGFPDDHEFLVPPTPW